jgi:hypothetical protein
MDGSPDHAASGDQKPMTYDLAIVGGGSAKDCRQLIRMWRTPHVTCTAFA